MEAERSETKEATGSDGDDGKVESNVDEDGGQYQRPGSEIGDRRSEVGDRRSE
jgi:hypothetical protein